MLATRFARLIVQPKDSFEAADREPAKPLDIIIHTALLALIPTVCGYIATVHIGWNLGAGPLFTVAAHKAIYIAIATFVSLNVGVYAMGFGVCWLATTFDVKPDPARCIDAHCLVARLHLVLVLEAIGHNFKLQWSHRANYQVRGIER